MNRPTSHLVGCLVFCLLFAGPWSAGASPAEPEPVALVAAGGAPEDEGWMFSAALYLSRVSIFDPLSPRRGEKVRMRGACLDRQNQERG